MRVVIRAFNKDDYHKDIVVMDDVQMRLFDERIDQRCSRSAMSGLIGISAGINPAEFPEMVRFEVVIVA